MPNWKKVIVSGSDAALNSLNITTALTASGLIYPTTDGIDGQVITTDGSGNLSFIDVGTSGTSGTSGLAFTHIQSPASDTWVINHSLDVSLLNITVTDEDKNVILPENIDLSDPNQAIITFGSATTGYAILSSMTGNPAGTSGTSGISGTSGLDGLIGTSGTSGTSGANGFNGVDGTSGTAGTSGLTGTSGTSGLDGESGGGGYIHTQSSALTTWNVTHNLDTRPLNVDVYDSSYNLIIIEDVSFPTADTAVITFPTPQDGFVIFSSISASYLADNNIVPNVDQYILTATGTSVISASQAFQIDNANSKLLATGSIDLQGSMTASGDIEANNFITTSDRNLKSQITEIGSGLEILKQFTAYEYIKNDEQDAGFIAQEVQEVIPYAVKPNGDGYLTMNDRPVLAHMHKAILELEIRIKNIEDKLG